MFVAERDDGFGRLELQIDVTHLAVQHRIPRQRVGQAEWMPQFLSLRPLPSILGRLGLFRVSQAPQVERESALANHARVL